MLGSGSEAESVTPDGVVGSVAASPGGGDVGGEPADPVCPETTELAVAVTVVWVPLVDALGEVAPSGCRVDLPWFAASLETPLRSFGYKTWPAPTARMAGDVVCASSETGGRMNGEDSGFLGNACARRLRRQRHARRPPRSTSAAIPPTMPPAMAPTFVCLLLPDVGGDAGEVAPAVGELEVSELVEDVLLAVPKGSVIRCHVGASRTGEQRTCLRVYHPTSRWSGW